MRQRLDTEPAAVMDFFFKFFKYTGEDIMRNTTAALFGLVLQVLRVQVYLY